MWGQWGRFLENKLCSNFDFESTVESYFRAIDCQKEFFFKKSAVKKWISAESVVTTEFSGNRLPKTIFRGIDCQEQALGVVMMIVHKTNYCSLAPPAPIAVCSVTITPQMSIFSLCLRVSLFFRWKFFFVHQLKEEVISFNLNRPVCWLWDFRFWKNLDRHRPFFKISKTFPKNFFSRRIFPKLHAL